jgi:hypothetical protein
MPAKPASTAARSPGRTRPIVWVLLALPYLALCFPRLYARATPVLMGFPFFYWYQFAWVVLTSCLLWIVYLYLRQPE